MKKQTNFTYTNVFQHDTECAMDPGSEDFEFECQFSNKFTLDKFFALWISSL